MAEERGRPDANRCFVCGPDNPIGLGIVFRLDGDVCKGEFTPNEDHVGFDGVTHGGIIFSVLDDVMANWLFLRGARGYTAKCEIRYRDMLPVNTTVQLESRVLKRKGKVVILEGKVSRADNGSLIAQSEASFMVTDPGPEELTKG